MLQRVPLVPSASAFGATGCMARFRLTIAYDGTAFHGWQKQHAPSESDPNTRVHLRTVQRVVEEAIREVIREPILLQGASRTDSGVHARCQTAAFTVPDWAPDPEAPSATPPVWVRLAPERLRLAINSRLPDDVTVLGLARTRDDFEPISDCVAKGYRYSLHAGLDRPLWDRAYVHHVRAPLDLARMQDAAARFVGEHDFAAFAAAGHGRLSTVRRVFSCEVTQHATEAAPQCPEASTPPQRFDIDISGSGFLHNMVRIIAGTIVEVGRGRMAPEQVDTALRSGDRRDAGPTLPPTGLCLMWMRYVGEGPATGDQ